MQNTVSKESSEAEKTLCMVFRKPNPMFFSIEKIFVQLAGQFSRQLKVKQVKVPHYSSSVTNILKNIWKLHREKANIYHITGDIHYGVLAFPSNKTILTIHDCVFLYKYKGAKKWVIDRFFLKWPVAHCKYVTTISEKSKQEIIKYSGCSADKIIVIPNPVPAAIYFEPKPFNRDRPTLLFIGSTPNKNLPRVLDALRGLSCKLRIIGNIDHPLQYQLKEYAIDYSLIAGISEEELAREYAAADIIVYPSLYEGFGLPVLEGQQAGRVVLTSNISPMKDVAADGAYLVDPYSVESIRKGLEELIGNEALREQIIDKGFANVRSYTEQATAIQYEKLYDRITAENSKNQI